jgi:hypothetical protein
MAIKDFSTTAANNTTVGGISVAEGMLPSNINNTFRGLATEIREWYNDSEWVVYGDGDGTHTFAYVSGTSFTVAGVDVTAIYHVNRRIRAVGSSTGTVYGTISVTAFSTNTTVTVVWDSGSLSSEALVISVAILSATNNSIPIATIGTTNIADSAVTTAKINADAITSAKIADDAIDSEHYTDGSIDTAHIASAQVTADKIGTSAVTTAKINADAVTSAKIADDQIDSEHYADGSIDTAHIAADQITSAKIADDQIDSEHYVDGSIDLAHLAANSVNSSKIVDGTIVNADVNASAAIDATKIHNGAVSNAEFAYINGVSSAIQTQIDAKAATTYVDNAVAGLRTRVIAECASTANVVISSALEAGDAIDGVTLVSGDRVLLKNQSTATENGLYLAVGSGAGAASRDPEHNSIAELSGGMVVVNQGSANDNKIFLCTTDTDATLGSTSITYTTITPQNVGTVTSVTAGTGLSGGAITSSGTIAIDTATTVDKTTAQTLTNKTLTSPKINEDVATTATATEINKLDALSRGSLIYGNASAVTTILTKGSADTVLTSDGTDISWSAPAGVPDNAITLAKMAAGTDGNVISYDASGNPVAVATGSDGQVLTSAGAGQPPAFETISTGLAWSATVITGSTLSAAVNVGYWINTTSNTCTITLPGSASVGDIINFSDYARTWGTNQIIIDSNGLNYQGGDDSYTVEYTTSGQSLNIIYSGATKGWIPFLDKEVANVPVAPPTQKGIFGFGTTGDFQNMTNLVSSSGVVATDTTGVGTARGFLAAGSYGGDKAIFGYGPNGGEVQNLTNKVSNSGVVASDTAGVGTGRYNLAAVEFGTDQLIFGYGQTGSLISLTNKVSNVGTVAADVTGVGTARYALAGSGYGSSGQGLFAYGFTAANVSMSNLVSNTGVVASDVTGVGTARSFLAAATYGGDKAVFAYGITGSVTSLKNLVSNTGIVAADVSGVGTARTEIAATNYGGDKAIFGFGAGNVSMTNLVNNLGVIGSDVTGVGTGRRSLGAAGFSFSA